MRSFYYSILYVCIGGLNGDRGDLERGRRAAVGLTGQRYRVFIQISCNGNGADYIIFILRTIFWSHKFIGRPTTYIYIAK